MKRLTVIVALLWAVLSPMAAGDANADSSHMRLYSSEGPFDDVKLFVKDAIINQGLVIDYNGRIGLMLERTRADVDGATKIYNQAEFFLFCSATISRATMEADPTNMSFCPYVVFLYELAKKPGKVYVGYRRPAIVGSEESKKSLVAVDELLHKIVKEAIE